MSSERTTSNQLTNCLAVIMTTLAATAAIWSQPAECQFLQPQSHLGRLVQSIASPLVLSSGLGGGNGVGAGASETEPSDAYDPELMGAQAQQAEEQRNLRHQPQNNQQYQPEADQHYQHYQRQRQHQQHQQQALEQAPSRGIPQRYYERQPQRHHNQHDDEDSPAAPTNQHRQQPVANEQYQMGAYLGPTIDDKEIQGAFNSNDDRDDDDAPGYDGPPAGTRSAANSYAASQPVESSGAYGDGGYYANGQRPNQFAGVDSSEPTAPTSRGAQRAGDFDDESNADEDDEPSARQRRPRRFRQSAAMSQAASQYHQRQNHYGQSQGATGQQDGGTQGPMMAAAANGYSPMGSNPFDLNSLMAAAAGAGANGQAYEVYNGDGSYPGYYPQQQQGRQRQAASMRNPYGYPNGNQMDGADYNNQNQNRQRGSDADDVDSDADED